MIEIEKFLKGKDGESQKESVYILLIFILDYLK